MTSVDGVNGVNGVNGAALVLRPGIRTYKPRRSRYTERAKQALEHPQGLLVPDEGPLDFATLWGDGTPVIADVGFGDGEATALLAAQEPYGVLAIDVHTPGVGELLARLQEQHLANVRVLEGDALSTLAARIPPHALAGLRTWFPDPWPKARHHKRRIVQPAVLDLAYSRLAPGGWWHLATDWAEYAEWIVETFGADPRWAGGPIPRPDWRPVTRYERRAVRDGRSSVDFVFTTVP
jgi:tRNA (guanine-N7-)-methyltransferase